MIQNFDKYTEDLNDLETRKILPEVENILKSRVGKWNAITNKEIVALLASRYVYTTEPRVRKMVHNLRVEGKVRWLIATSNGYYIARTVAEMEDYLRSLKARANSIMEVYNQMQRQLSGELPLNYE